MPEGQYTGQRRKYVYTDDTDEKYVLTMDSTLATVAGTGLTEYNPTDAEKLPGRPARFKPRVVFWQGVLNNRTVRKQIVCGTTDGALYAAEGSGALAIDGVNGITTGRRGERITY